ncbi:AAA family ATPase [Candidatus Bathyarchaeota archaeon]|nr:AAA family ATPase [Candidatus Bathyarchaeota archaeon]
MISSLDSIFSFILPSHCEITVSRGGENNIFHRHILIHGAMGSGKTETAKTIVQNLQLVYGSENVHAAWAESSINDLFQQIRPTPVNILVAEDLTLRKHDPEALNRFFRVRHLVKELTGRNTGLVVTVVTAHRLHGLDKELRCDIDLLLAKSIPKNPWDYEILSRFFGEQLLEEFENMKLNGADEGLTLWYVSPVRRGIIHLPLSGTLRTLTVKKLTPVELKVTPEPVKPVTPNIRMKRRVLRLIAEGNQNLKKIADLSHPPDLPYNMILNRRNRQLWRRIFRQDIVPSMVHDGLIWHGKAHWYSLRKKWHLTENGMRTLMSGKKRRR